MNKVVYNIDDLCTLLDLSRATIARACRDGKMPATIAAGGKRLVWVKRVIDEWIESGCPLPEEMGLEPRKSYKRKPNKKPRTPKEST